MARRTLLAAVLLLPAAAAQNACNPAGGALSAFPCCNQSLSPAVRAQDLAARLTLNETISQLGTTAAAISRLDLPSLAFGGEALHGVWASCVEGRCPTQFPAPHNLGRAFAAWIFRGQIATATWIFREDELRCGGPRQFGRDPASASWIFRGRIAATATRIVRGDELRQFGRDPARASGTFDKDLWRAVGAATSLEARALFRYNQAHDAANCSKGLEGCLGLTYYAPNLNLARDPRWGRVEEVPGEDPTLSRAYGAAFVAGFQGNGTYRVANAVVKHFVACVRGVDLPLMNRGGAAAATWAFRGDDARQRRRLRRGSFRGDESRRRRGWDVAIPCRRVAAAPRPRRGYSVEINRGGAAAATWLLRADESRRRRGRDVAIPLR